MTRTYGTPHDLAIKAANWVMKDDPKCAAAHQRCMEVPKARAAFEAANAEWSKITKKVFNRVMAEAGFSQ